MSNRGLLKSVLVKIDSGCQPTLHKSTRSMLDEQRRWYFFADSCFCYLNFFKSLIMLVPPAGHIQEHLKNVYLYNLNEHKQKDSNGFLNDSP